MVGDRHGSGGKDAARAADAPRDGGGDPVIDAAQLLRGRRAVAIRHHGELYRLSVTSKDKLILTK